MRPFLTHNLLWLQVWGRLAGAHASLVALHSLAAGGSPCWRSSSRLSLPTHTEHELLGRRRRGGCSPAERPPCREVGAAGGGIMVREGGRGVEQEGRMPRKTASLIALAAEECLAWLKLGISSNKGIIRTLFTVLSRIITNKCIIAS